MNVARWSVHMQLPTNWKVEKLAHPYTFSLAVPQGSWNQLVLLDTNPLGQTPFNVSTDDEETIICKM
jgi:hypothetical protein